MNTTKPHMQILGSDLVEPDAARNLRDHLALVMGGVLVSALVGCRLVLKRASRYVCSVGPLSSALAGVSRASVQAARCPPCTGRAEALIFILAAPGILVARRGPITFKRL